MFYLKSKVKSELTIVQASSSADNDVNPFRINLKIMCLFVSFAAIMSLQFSTGCYVVTFRFIGSSACTVAGFAVGLLFTNPFIS